MLAGRVVAHLNAWRFGLLAMAAALAVLGVVASCHDEPTIEERVAARIVVTKLDPDANFAAFATFALPDSVSLIRAIDAGATPAVVDAAPSTSVLAPAIAQPLLDAIAGQLTGRGYQRVLRTEGPDLGVAVTALELTNASTVTYGDWWHTGAASPPFWGYDGVEVLAPFAYVTLAWQSGTVVVELDDLREARAQKAGASTPTIAAVATPPAFVRIAWAAVLHGVISESTGAPPIDALSQAFAQSPYLHR